MVGVDSDDNIYKDMLKNKLVYKILNLLFLLVLSSCPYFINLVIELTMHIYTAVVGVFESIFLYNAIAVSCTWV